MNKVYKKIFNKNSKVIAYGSTMINNTDSKVLEKYKIDKNNYYLIVGRLIPDNNSRLIIEGFIKSESKKKIVIVGDVPYFDKYALMLKSLASNKIIFTGYIEHQKDLSYLYDNCYGYLHGHEYGGTNPTMINALSLGCNIIALNTVFNIEMLSGKKAIFFDKNIQSVSKSIKEFEKNRSSIIQMNESYVLKENYEWNFILNKYEEVFNKLKKR